MTQLRESDLSALLIAEPNRATLTPEQRRRLLACGLDELEREAYQLERTAIQWVNQLRALQGKRPVIVPKG